MVTDSQPEQMKRSGLSAERTPSGEAPAHTTPLKSRKTVWQRTRRVLLLFALLIVLLLGTGLLYQGIASTHDASSYPPPGKLIDVGGYRLHLYCTGTSRPGSPTVILEAGAGDTSLVWSKVQPGVASFTRVCSYDRAGWGWSDTGPLPPTSRRNVTELHTLLARAGVPGPYVLVGHSHGGLITQMYVYTYPQQVAGLVLVDSENEDELVRPSRLRQDILSSMNSPIYPICQALAPFGIVRLLGLLNGTVADYPPPVPPAVKAQLYQTRYCQSAYNEGAALAESFAQVRAARYPLGHLPLVVLSRGLPVFTDPQAEQDWQAFQRNLAGISSDSVHIIATRSGHHIQLDQPDLVIAAIRQVLTGKV